jgi:hypothetical protein
LSLCNFLRPRHFCYNFTKYIPRPLLLHTALRCDMNFTEKGSKSNITITRIYIYIHIYIYTYARRHMAYSTTSKLPREFTLLSSINTAHNTNATTNSCEVRAGSAEYSYGGTLHKVTGGYMHGNFSTCTLAYDLYSLKYANRQGKVYAVLAVTLSFITHSVLCNAVPLTSGCKCHCTSHIRSAGIKI